MPSLAAPMLAFVTTCLEVGKRQIAASDLGGILSPSLVCVGMSQGPWMLGAWERWPVMGRYPKVWLPRTPSHLVQTWLVSQT